MNSHLPDGLKQFSAQDIHLELIRRAGGNFDGEAVAQMLLANRSLWVAAMIDNLHMMPHPAVPTFGIPVLYKLRDVPHNRWNTDTLYVVTPDQASRDRFIAISETTIGGMPLLFNEAQCEQML